MGRWGNRRGSWASLLVCGLLAGTAHAAATQVTVSLDIAIANGPSPTVAVAGGSTSTQLEALITSTPKPHEEATITNETWTWSAAVATTGSPTGASGSVSPKDTDATWLTTTATAGGTAGIPVTVTYSADSADGKYHFSGSATRTISATFAGLVIDVAGARQCKPGDPGYSPGGNTWGAAQTRGKDNSVVTLSTHFTPATPTPTAPSISWTGGPRPAQQATYILPRTGDPQHLDRNQTFNVTATCGTASALVTVVIAAWTAGSSASVGMSVNKVPAGASVQAQTDDVLAFGLRGWSDPDTNAFEDTPRQDTADWANASWTMEEWLVDDTGSGIWAPMDYSGTGETFRFTLLCGPKYRVTATVPDKGYWAKDPDPAVVRVVVENDATCGCGGGSLQSPP